MSIAPLEIPVVPPVYCSIAIESGLTGGRPNGSLVPSAMARSKGSAPGMDQGFTAFFTRRRTKFTMGPFTGPSQSPIDATRTGTGRRSRSATSAVAAKFSSTMSAPASASASCAASSRAV